MKLDDTSPSAQSIQIKILQKMSPDERLSIALELAATSRELLAQGVRKRHPEYSEDEVRLAVIRLQLPEALFQKAYPHALNIVP